MTVAARARLLRLAALVAALDQLRPDVRVEGLKQPRWLPLRPLPFNESSRHGRTGSVTKTPLLISGGGTNGRSPEPARGSSSTTEHDETSLEDLTKDTPSTVLLFLTVLDLYWHVLLPKLIYHPLALVPIYFALRQAVSMAYHHRALRTLLIFAGTLPPAASLLYLCVGTYHFVRSRKPPSAAAASILRTRIQGGRAARTVSGSDVFYPPPGRSRRIGVLFFPGALVHHSAYAPVAGRLSDRGIAVVVVSLEPSRFVADVAANRRRARRALAECGAEVDVDEWVLAGHSAGARTAFHLAASARAPGAVFAARAVLCGVGPVEFGTGPTLRDARCEVLVINASRDGVIASASAEGRRAFRAGLPLTEGDDQGGRITYAIIEGGNHAGFADYGRQFMDGNRTISLEEQHRTVVRETAVFLLNAKRRRWF